MSNVDLKVAVSLIGSIIGTTFLLINFFQLIHVLRLIHTAYLLDMDNTSLSPPNAIFKLW